MQDKAISWAVVGSPWTCWGPYTSNVAKSGVVLLNCGGPVGNPPTFILENKACRREYAPFKTENLLLANAVLLLSKAHMLCLFFFFLPKEKYIFSHHQNVTRTKMGVARTATTDYMLPSPALHGSNQREPTGMHTSTHLIGSKLKINENLICHLQWSSKAIFNKHDKSINSILVAHHHSMRIQKDSKYIAAKIEHPQYIYVHMFILVALFPS